MGLLQSGPTPAQQTQVQNRQQPAVSPKTNLNQSIKQVNVKKMIPDNYKTMEEVQEALREAGLESSNLIIGIDYTKSNTWTGTKSFGGQCLHTINPQIPLYNPYQRVIDIIGRTLSPFDDDNLIPIYGFGDITTQNKSVFSFMPNDHPCNGLEEVMRRYNEITPQIQMSGPTNFAPLIRKSIDIVRNTQQYHILLIIADGQVDNEKETIAAIVEASNYPLSIVCIGVGDGPFDKMMEFDDKLVDNKFDNFQFVNYFEVVSQAPELQDVIFAVKALQEIPDQYKFIKENGYLDE